MISTNTQVIIVLVFSMIALISGGSAPKFCTCRTAGTNNRCNVSGCSIGNNVNCDPTTFSTFSVCNYDTGGVSNYAACACPGYNPTAGFYGSHTYDFNNCTTFGSVPYVSNYGATSANADTAAACCNYCCSSRRDFRGD